jgi:hypothetical protein
MEEVLEVEEITECALLAAAEIPTARSDKSVLTSHLLIVFELKR